jgi:hypothetical protein
MLGFLNALLDRYDLSDNFDEKTLSSFWFLLLALKSRLLFELSLEDFFPLEETEDF